MSIKAVEKEILSCLAILNRGGTILYPTDTIWGIGCDATNSSAVEKIFSLKKRNPNKPIICLVSDLKMLKNYIYDIPAPLIKLIDEHKKPITVIYPQARGISKKLTASDGSIGIRIVKNTFCKSLIHKFQKPITSTSANISGENFPKNFEQISKEILENVGYIVNLHQNKINDNAPSTIVQMTPQGEINFIRP